MFPSLIATGIPASQSIIRKTKNAHDILMLDVFPDSDNEGGVSESTKNQTKKGGEGKSNLKKMSDENDGNGSQKSERNQRIHSIIAIFIIIQDYLFFCVYT